MLLAREEEPAANGGDPGPLVLRYGASPHCRKRHVVDRNDLILRPERVELADGALQLGASGSVLDREIQVVTVGVDAHHCRGGRADACEHGIEGTVASRAAVGKNARSGAKHCERPLAAPGPEPYAGIA